MLGLYRWAVVGALGALAAGFIYRRAEQHGEGDLKGWASIANERQGAILVLLLLGVLMAAGLVAELIVPAVAWTWRKVKARI